MPTICDLTEGWLLADVCKDNIGGVRLAGIAKFDSDVAGAVGLTGSYDNIIESFGSATPSFYKFEQGNEEASLVVNGTFNSTSAFWSPELTISIPGMTSDALGITTILGKGYWFCLAEDKKGNTYLCNLFNPMEVTSDASTFGQAAADVVGSTLVFTTSETQKPYLVDPDIVASLYAN
jgi:hypothetical protein